MPSDRLARFASCALSIDYPRGSTLAAAAILSFMSAAPTQAGPAALAIIAISAPKFVAKPSSPTAKAPAPVAAPDYTALVREVQAAADTAFGTSAVVILDRSASPELEMRRFARASGYTQSHADTLVKGGSGSHGRGDGRIGCVIIGEHPSARPEDIFKTAGVAPGPSDVAWEDAQRWALTSALGQCRVQGGLTPEQGYAFATLATVTASRSKDLPGLLARHVELKHTVETASSERLGPIVASATRWGTPASKAQPDYRELFAKARAIAPERESIPEPSSYLAGMKRVAQEALFYVPVKEGAVATDQNGWMRAYANAPGFSRAIRVLDDYAAGRFGEVPGDPASSSGWELPMRKAAAQGDPAAAIMVKARKPTQRNMPDAPSPERLASSVKGTHIPFDRDHQHISFEGERFTVSDTDGNEVANGTHDKGIEEESVAWARPR